MQYVQLLLRDAEVRMLVVDDWKKSSRMQPIILRTHLTADLRDAVLNNKNSVVTGIAMYYTFAIIYAELRSNK